MISLFSPKEAAELLGVSYRKILDLILIGQLQAFKVGNAYRIAEADLKEYLEANRFKSEWPT